MSFHIIPALDILNGRVVSAGGSGPQRYRPLISQITNRDEPVAVITALLKHHPFRSVYLADLNALRLGDRSATETLAGLAVRFPGLDLWLDGAAPLPSRPACRQPRTVYGSEWASPAVTDDPEWAQAILSLDSMGDQPLGDNLWWQQPSLWPRRVIIIDMQRVGSHDGPDWQWISRIQGMAGPQRCVWAGGGARHKEDLQRLRDMGLSGALVATALHTGKLFPLQETAGES